MDEGAGKREQGFSARRWLPVALLAGALAAFLAAGLGRYLTFASLAAHHEELMGVVSRLGFLAFIAFIAVYAAVTALSVPFGAFLTVTGGLLFGTFAGGLCALLGATLGATTVFLVARTSFGEPLRRRAGPFLRKVEAGFRENATSYLLILRLVPLFPFWLVNLVPALFAVALRTFVVASLFGMAPATFVYASLGAGLGTIVAKGQAPDLGLLLEGRVLAPLLGLAVLAALPVAYKRWRAASRGAPP